MVKNYNQNLEKGVNELIAILTSKTDWPYPGDQQEINAIIQSLQTNNPLSTGVKGPTNIPPIGATNTPGETGKNEIDICLVSGKLPSSNCNPNKIVKRSFKTGKEPTGICTKCKAPQIDTKIIIRNQRTGNVTNKFIQGDIIQINAVVTQNTKTTADFKIIWSIEDLTTRNSIPTQNSGSGPFAGDPAQQLVYTDTLSYAPKKDKLIEITLDVTENDILLSQKKIKCIITPKPGTRQRGPIPDSNASNISFRVTDEQDIEYRDPTRPLKVNLSTISNKILATLNGMDISGVEYIWAYAPINNNGDILIKPPIPFKTNTRELYHTQILSELRGTKYRLFRIGCRPIKNKTLLNDSGNNSIGADIIIKIEFGLETEGQLSLPERIGEEIPIKEKAGIFSRMGNWFRRKKKPTAETIPREESSAQEEIPQPKPNKIKEAKDKNQYITEIIDARTKASTFRKINIVEIKDLETYSLLEKRKAKLILNLTTKAKKTKLLKFNWYTRLLEEDKEVENIITISANTKSEISYGELINLVKENTLKNNKFYRIYCLPVKDNVTIPEPVPVFMEIYFGLTNIPSIEKVIASQETEKETILLNLYTEEGELMSGLDSKLITLYPNTEANFTVITTPVNLVEQRKLKYKWVAVKKDENKVIELETTTDSVNYAFLYGKITEGVWNLKCSLIETSFPFRKRIILSAEGSIIKLKTEGEKEALLLEGKKLNPQIIRIYHGKELPKKKKGKK